MTFYTFRSLLGLLLSCVVVTSQAAFFEDEEARRAILDLRQRIQANQNESQEESAQIRQSLLDLQAQLDSLRSEIKQLRGEQESQQQALMTLDRTQKTLGLSLDQRLRPFEPIVVKVDGQEFTAISAEKAGFESALQLLRNSQFDQAQHALEIFMTKYPQSGYLPSALFWLGNASYALKDYKAAQSQFELMVTTAPMHARAPEAMLALANVQIERKDLKGARQTLEDLLSKYADSEVAATAKQRLTQLR